jgi:cytoplasmic iron level regulating protein YaaA (DUF328/UPF0246 family)
MNQKLPILSGVFGICGILENMEPYTATRERTTPVAPAGS